MSLIAILTVSFTAQASTAVDSDADVIMTVEDGSVSLDSTIVAPDVSLDCVVMELLAEGSVVLDVAELSVSSEGLGGSQAEAVPIVPSIGTSPDIFALFNFISFDLPDLIPLSEASITISEKSKHTNKCNDSINEWFGTHTGKLNNRTNIS